MVSPFTSLLVKPEVSHIRTSSRAIYCEETQARGWNVVQLGISMSHQFIGFLGCRIQRNRIIHLVICAVRDFLVGAIDAGGGSINQMLQTLAMAAGFEDIKEADQVGFHISIRIGDGVTHTSLCCKIHDHSGLIFLEQLCDQCLVSDVPFTKVNVGYFINSFKRNSFNLIS